MMTIDDVFTGGYQKGWGVPPPPPPPKAGVSTCVARRRRAKKVIYTCQYIMVI